MAQYRKEPLEKDYYYHIFSRSIAKYIVFNNEEDFARFIEIFELYKHINFSYQYSKFVRLDSGIQRQIINELQTDDDVLVEVVAYCLMPTHMHFLLKQVAKNGISIFMAKILNCYSRYFNIRHNRTGPLWSSRFKSVLVSSDEQLLHLTRYIHLNPVSAGLVAKPDKWPSSSYDEYIDTNDSVLTNYSDIFTITPEEYKKFVLDHKGYQRDLSIIKNLILDDYSG